MVAATHIKMADIARQRRYETDLGGDLRPSHTVGQAIEHYREQVSIPGDHGMRWTAFARGVRLDNKRLLSDVPEADAEWTVMPEVSAGCL